MGWPTKTRRAGGGGRGKHNTIVEMCTRPFNARSGDDNAVHTRNFKIFPIRVPCSSEASQSKIQPSEAPSSVPTPG